jgi:hypothetical protein
MLINLWEIKKIVNEIIPLIEELVEEHGMDGDTGMAEQFEVDLESFKKAKEELNEFLNSDIPRFALRGEIEKHVPSITIDDFLHYLDMLKTRKSHEIEVLKHQIDKHDIVKDALLIKGGLQ